MPAGVKDALKLEGILESPVNLATYEKSLEYALQAVRMEPDHGFSQANLGMTYLALGRLDEASAVADTMEAKGLGAFNVAFIRASLAGAAGDEEGVRQASAIFEGTPGEFGRVAGLGEWAARRSQR